MNETFQDSLKRFEKTSQAHEKEVVIDLALDRIIKYFGAYGIGILAATTIIFAVIGPVLTCDTAGECNNPAKAKFIDSFCWGSTSVNNQMCHERYPFDNETTLLSSHEEIREFYQIFPYLLIGQAIAFMLPWAYWHFRMGSRLTGQILFMKSFLEEMHELLKDVKNGNYTGKPFDKDSNTFYGGEEFPTNKAKKRKTKLPDDDEALAELTGNETNTIPKVVETSNVKENANKKTKLSKEISIWKFCKDMFFTFVTGNMKDRHLFSIFCYENFASMEHLPFLLSTFEASKQDKNVPEEPESNMYSIKACILYQWCHPKNFSNIRLVKVYFAKHLVTALFALGNMIGMLFWFFSFLREKEGNTSSLIRCFLPFEDTCVVCAINRKREMFFFFWLDIASLCLIMLLSVGHWLATMRSVNLAKCHYFEKIKRPCKVTIDAKNENN